MGACSSKPKTTEFEGPVESTKEIKESPDHGIDAVDASQVSERLLEPANEIPAKSEEEDGNASSEAVHERHGLSAGKDEEPKVGLPISAEGFLSSNAFPSIEEKKAGKEGAGTVDDGEAGYEKGKAGDVVALKDDVRDAAAQNGDVGDKEEAKDKVTSVGGDLDGDAVDEVAIDEERAHESLGSKGSITTQDENVQGITESPGGESPINGVVQSAQPTHLDDALERVGMAPIETTAPDEPTPSLATEKVDNSRAEDEGDVSRGSSSRKGDISVAKEGGNFSSRLPREVGNVLEESGSTSTTQPAEDVNLQDGSKVSPLLIDVSEDGEGLATGANVTSGEDLLPVSAEARDALGVREGTLADVTKLDTITDSQKKVGESTSEPLWKPALDENFAENTGESHVKVAESGGNIGTLYDSVGGAPKSLEDIDAEILNSKPKVETTPEEVNEEKGEAIVDEPAVQPQSLAVEESVEDVERKEKVEESQNVEATPAKAKVESADTQFLMSLADRSISASGEGEFPFEDASDVPLKVESSNPEPGQAPSL